MYNYEQILNSDFLSVKWHVRSYPANIDLFKFNNRNTRNMCEIC